MSLLSIVVTLLVVLLVVTAIVTNLRAIYALRSLRALGAEAPDLERWPKVSVVVPACDEADTIEEAAKTLMQMDYPDLEVILIDDRSTDGTSEIVDQLAALDERVRAVHITELPEGWLGKLYALHRGTQAASNFEQ